MKILAALFAIGTGQNIGTSENTDGIFADKERIKINELPLPEQKIALGKLFDKIGE